MSLLASSLVSCNRFIKGSQKDEPHESVTLPHPELPLDEAGEYEDSHLVNAENDHPAQSSASSGKVTIGFSSTVLVDLSDRTITMNYTDANSNRDAIVVLEISGTVIGRSHIVKPGTVLTEMVLEESVVARLQEGGYIGELVVGYYCSETGNKDFLETTIPVTVYVKN